MTIESSNDAIRRLVVIGAGAVGGCISGLLADQSFPVAMVARGSHGERIRDNGLWVRMPEREIHVHPECHQSLADVEWRKGDVALIATKLQDVRGVLNQLLECTSDQTPIVCASNGIHAEQWANERFENVISMLVWMPATYLTDGEVKLYGGPCRGVLDNGPYPDTSKDENGTTISQKKSIAISQQLCRWLQDAGFDAVSRTDMQRWKYAKWITNLGNAAQALVTDDWKSIAKAAQAEGESVLAASGISRVSTKELLERCSSTQLRDIGGQSRQGGSTWQSLQRGKRLESEWLEGAMVRLAMELGIETPVLRFLAEVSESPRPLLASEVLAG